MQPDTAHIRSDAFRILTVATIVMGGGLFEAFSRTPPDPSVVEMPGLLYVKVLFVGQGLIAYLGILVGVFRLLPRDTLKGQDLKHPFSLLIFLFLMVSALFLIHLGERIALAFS